MEKALLLKDGCWLNISNGLAFHWWRWLANIEYDKLGHGGRAWVRKRGEDWYEFHFRRDTNAAQPGANVDFQIMFWKNWGTSLQYRVE